MFVVGKIAAQTPSEALAAGSFDAVYSWDRAGNIISWNQAAHELFGYTEHEIMGQPVLALVPARRRDEYRMLLRSVNAGDTVTLSTIRTTQSGREIEVALRIIPIRDGDEHGACAMEIVRAELGLGPLEDEHRLLREIVNRIPIGITVLEREVADDPGSYRFVLTNPVIADYVTRYADDWIGKTMRERFPQLVGSELTDCYGMALSTGEPQALIGLHFGDDPKMPEQVVDVVAIPIGKDLLAVVSQDVSERAATAARLEALLHTVERSNAELEQYAHVASHDLREPVRTMLSYCQLLHDNYLQQLDPRGRESANYVMQAANRMHILIEDLLNYSRITQPETPGTVCLDTALDEVMQNLQAAISKTGAVIRRKPLPVIAGYRSQVIQLLQNLLSNALKFSRGVPVVNVSAEMNDSEWVITMADHGIGIAPEFHDTIFDMCTRLNHRDLFPGSGIGLAICRRVVERHQGRIWVESIPGVGTAFKFSLPHR